MADYSSAAIPVPGRLRSSGLFEPCQRLAWDNPPWADAAGRYLVVRLSPLRDMVSSSGHLFLHRLIRAALGPAVFIDFAFLPAASDRRELSSAGIPFMTGVCGLHGPEDYSAILVSCSYAPEMMNLPLMLLNSGIPARSSMRQGVRPDGRRWPLIVLGGSNALASQALIFPDGDSFVDGIFFGEGEDGGLELVSAIAATDGLAPQERAARAAAATSSFRPAGSPESARTPVARCGNGSASPISVDRYPLLNTGDASTARLQISWGCPSTCSFCFEGWEHKPYREAPASQVLETARSLARETGTRTLEIYSFNFNAHSAAGELIVALNGIFDRVNMMSQRADLLEATPGMLSLELAAGKTSFTIGVEGISAGMRAWYSKGLSNDALRRLLERLVREKIREIKLFFILAGIEDDSDFDDFEAFCSFLRGALHQTDHGPRVVFSFGWLVRMPFTPLGGAGLCLDRKLLETLAGRAGGIVTRAGFEFRMAVEWDEYLLDQLLVIGPREMAFALEKTAAEGAVFDLSPGGGPGAALLETLRACGAIDRDRMTGPLAGRRDGDFGWPLGFLDPGVDSRYLMSRLGMADRREDGSSCMQGLGDGRCTACGACRTPAERGALAAHRIEPAAPAQVRVLAALVRAKRRMLPRYVGARLPESLSGATPEFLEAWLMRAVLSRCPELIGRLFRVGEALWSSPENRDRFVTGMTGYCVLALHGLDEAVGDEPPRLSGESFAKAVAALGAALGSPVHEIDALPEPAGMVVRIVLPGAPDQQDLLKRVRAYLTDLRLNAVERRTDGGRLFEIAPKDQKKRILKSVAVVSGQVDGASASPVVLDGGPRLDVSKFFRNPADRALTLVHVDRVDGFEG